MADFEPGLDFARDGDPVDVCLLLEGTYPYVSGGVSTWVNDLIRAQSHLRFHCVALLADRKERAFKYPIAGNVVGLAHVYLQQPDAGPSSARGLRKLFKNLQPSLLSIQGRGTIADLERVLSVLAPRRADLGAETLLNSPEAWRTLVRMYEATVPDCSFLDYFWTWRAQLGGLFACLLAPLPDARVYHTISTGYAGLMATRGALETGRPCFVTEHGIYTNERRIEITMADWLSSNRPRALAVERERRDLKDLWIDTFISYSQCLYSAARSIVTLYEGNQAMQRRDGAPPGRLRIIPNGIDYDAYAAVPREDAGRPPTVALIGRVVPIKDIKTFIRAVAVAHREVPDLQALILGPEDEDPAYAAECKDLARMLKLDGTLRFMGRQKLTDWLGKIDALALTSVSEAQPLVILEGGAAGVPTVATDVGACREMIEGRSEESPALGPGGEVTPLADPQTTGRALARLLKDKDWHARCSAAIRKRVEILYNKKSIDAVYRDLYEEYRQAPDKRPGVEAA
ncbi:MAG: GT4 family glycosyltransferase PelF [Rhodospirillales bacterium]|nr:GT4 family glycosyltransferase PelF [Rhodospirillales bacterium]